MVYITLKIICSEGYKIADKVRVWPVGSQVSMSEWIWECVYIRIIIISMGRNVFLRS